MAALKVLSLPTHAQPRIVEILEGLLERARAGNVQGISVVTDEDGDMKLYRDGFTDERALWVLEITKARLMKGFT